MDCPPHSHPHPHPRAALLPRRGLLAGAALLAALAPLGAAAQATWPTKTVTLVVPFAAGGTTDIIARSIAERLQAAIGQTVVVDNRAGGNTAIASQYVRGAAPDGHTLYIWPYANVTLNILNPKTFNFDPLKDFTPITNLAGALTAVTVTPSLPVKNIKELTDLARSRPGEISWGIVSVGGNDHLFPLAIEKQAGVKFNIVPYKGSAQANQDLMSGQLHAKTDGWATAKPLADAGRVRILGQMEQGPSPLAPGVPAIAETFPGLGYSSDFCLVGPKGIPPAIVERINKEVTTVLRGPELNAKLNALGVLTKPTTPQEMARVIQTTYDSSLKAIREANISLQE